MKRFLIFFNLYFFSSFFFVGSTYSQNISQLLNDLKSKAGEITIDKTTYNQSFEIVDEVKGKIKYESVAVSEKGESSKSAYEFYISDIDKNTLVRKPSGKKFFVSLWLNNKQKFIKYYKEDKLEAYTDNIEIMVLGADVAQEVIDIFKSAIPLVKNTEKTWTTPIEALNWLKSNIGEAKDKTVSKQQSLTYNGTNNNLIEINIKSTDAKGAVTEDNYNLNLTDLNKNKLSVKVSGASLNVVLETKNNDKYIRFNKGNEIQNYVSDIEIAADDIDLARNIISAFSIAIEKSTAKKMEFKTPQAAMEFIKTNLVETGQKSLQQKIQFSNTKPVYCTFVTDETDSKGKNISNQYEFYLIDIEPNVIFKVSGKKVSIPMGISGKSKYIRYSKDNVLQNYTEDMEIYTGDIETARNLLEAINTAIKTSVETPVKFTSVAEAMKLIQTNIEGATIGADQYKLSFEFKTAEPFACNYIINKTDAKGVTTEENYLFYPYFIDVNAVKVETDGKYLSVVATMTGKKAFVKKIKKEQNSFDNEMSFMCFDVKKAKDIAAALRFLSANTAPKTKTYATKQAALEFVKQNIAEVNAGTKNIKQKVEFAVENPCLATFTINTTDDKSKTTEEIYEFSLSDINKQLIDFKPEGANISIVLTCKNKQKLVKAYKDGSQQSFAADVRILSADVELSKNIADALKFAVGNCE